MMGLVLPWWVKPAAIVALVVAVWVHGRMYQAELMQAERNESIIEAWQEGDRHVANYIRRSRELADDLVVADRLGRLCRGQLRRARNVDGAAPPNPADRAADAGIGDLGRELKLAQDNRFKCESLQDAVRPQLVKPARWWEIWK